MKAALAIALTIRITITITIGIVMTGCTTTVIPDHVKPAAASFDGNAQDSGVVVQLQDGSALVSVHWVERYNAMVTQYGACFQPPLKPLDAAQQAAVIAVGDASRPACAVTAQVLTDFLTMNRWRKEKQPGCPSGSVPLHPFPN